MGLLRLPPSVQDVVRAGLRRVRRARRQAPRLPVVSLVVPVYGVERYLPACLDSLLAQTHPALEIIAVDDGSPDRSLEILRAYAARDKRITIIRQTNAGLSAARNAGAKAATGTYLMFVDSDDTLEPAAIKTFVRSLERTGSDFAVASYRRFNSAGITPAAWWIRRAHRISRPATNVKEFPDIQVNAVAWSKCYRRAFWVEHAFAFPVGVLYEDQAVSSRAYVKARSLDVLAQVLCNWRIRDDRSSISQQTAEVHDLQARLDAASQSLEQLDQPGFEGAREVRLAHYLSNDFPLSIKAAQHGDDEFWAVLRDGLRQLTEHATPEVWERVSAQHRVATALVMADHRAETTWFVGLGHNNPKNSPTVAQGGHVYTDIEVRHVLGMEVTDPFLALSPHQLELISSVRRAFWSAQGSLMVEGWAYIDNLNLAEVRPAIRAWCELLTGPGLGTPDRVELAVEAKRVVEVTAASRHRYADYENSGFVLTIDPAALVQATAAGAEKADWRIVLEVSACGLTRTGPLAKLDPAGSAGRLTAHFHADRQVLPVFSRRDGLLVSVRSLGDQVERAEITDRSLTLTVAPDPVRNPLGLELAERVSRQTVRSAFRRLPSGAAHTMVVVPEMAGEPEDRLTTRTWTAQVVGMVGTKSSASVLSDGAVDLRPTSSPYAGRTLQGTLTVVDEPRAVWIDYAAVTDEGALQIGGQVLGVLVEDLVFTVQTAKASGFARATARSVGSFEATIPMRYSLWQLEETVLPLGGYTLTCRLDGATPLVGESDVAVHLAAELIDTLPQPFATKLLRGQLRLVRPDGLQVLLEPPLSDLERGSRRQQQLQTRLAQRLPDPDFEFGAVLFRSYYGEIAGCNPLAVHRELRRRNTRHTLYWAVQDMSVHVPEGGIPVIHESAEWYRLLHDAHFYLDNMHQAIYHVKPAHQIQVQTFHGYPFKQMGQSHWAWQNRDTAHVQSYLDRARDWDYLVSPASYGTEALCREFGFPNEVLEIGYPRNDVLLSPDAPALAGSVRARLGIRPEQTALLYAPTFRDELAQNDFKALMVDFLDINRLAAELGEDYVVLVRGHAFNARLDSRVGSRGNIIDMTDYPDIAELCLASDAAIVDYSSLRFDYALTGQPMIFMVPDLEQYQQTSRGAIIDYEPTAPGPLVKTTAEVVAAAADLGRLRRDYAEPYATFRRNFLDLDDGHAAERLVDRVFMVDGL